MSYEMTFDDALVQLRRVAGRHESAKGLLHDIANTLERTRFDLPDDPERIREMMNNGDWWAIAMKYAPKEAT
jgi:hypothetical protein